MGRRIFEDITDNFSLTFLRQLKKVHDLNPDVSAEEVNRDVDQAIKEFVKDADSH